MKYHYLLAAITVMAAMTSTVIASDEKKLLLSIEAGIEYDDNVSVSVLDQNTGQSDEAFVIDLSANYIVSKTQSQEIELSYDFYQSLHDSFDDFDLQMHIFSASGSWVFNELDTGLNYSFSKIRLGDNALYDSHNLTPTLGFGGLENWYHQFSYGYLDKDFTSNNNARDASQNSIAADNFYLFMEGKAFISAGLRFEDENAESAEFDYQGIYLKAGASVPLTEGADGFKLIANYQHYWRDYDNVTVSIGEKRDDEQDMISLEINKPIYTDILAKFSYEYSNTDSNLPSADSTENIFKVSLKADF